MNISKTKVKFRHFDTQVIGRHDSLGLSDEQRLPYIRAVLHESHRSSALLFNGIPRRNSSDFTLKNGMVIPANTTVFANM